MIGDHGTMDYGPDGRQNWPPPPGEQNGAPSYSAPYAYVDPAAQALKDDEHLKLLSIFHIILGALTALTACIFLFHVGFGLMMANNQAFFASGAKGPNAAPPAFFGYTMAAMGGIALLAGWVMGALNIAAGIYLKQRKNMTFLLVVAGIDCLVAMPIGTVLGVFTFIVLFRPSVKTLFQGTPLY